MRRLKIPILHAAAVSTALCVLIPALAWAQISESAPITKAEPPSEVVQRFHFQEPALFDSTEREPSEADIDLQIRGLIESTISREMPETLGETSPLRVMEPGEDRSSSQPLRRVGNKYLGAYRLELQGVPLSESTSVSTAILRDGSAATLRERNTPTSFDFDAGADIPPQVRVSVDDAVQAATNEIRRIASQRDEDRAPRSLGLRDGQLEVWVEPRERVGKLAWALTLVEFEAATSETPPQAFQVWVDATAERAPIEVFEIKELLVYQNDGTLKGTMWDPTPFDPAQMVSVGSARITRTTEKAPLNAVSVFTDDDGSFRFPDGERGGTFVGKLENRYFGIENASGPLIEIKGVGDGADPVDLVAPADNDEQIAQTSGFIWANRARRFVEDVLNDDELEDVEVNVNAPGECNASWSSLDKRITLFRASPEGSSRNCLNKAYKDTVFHEFGHAVDWALGGISSTLGGRAYSEGFGDSLAILLKDDPCYGSASFGHGTCLRDAANPVIRYPGTNLGIHQRGRIFSGFVWELINELSNDRRTRDEAISVARDLVLQTAVLDPTDIENAVALVFEVDDDDLDLSNGTPNSRAIIAAASSRDIPVPSELRGPHSSSSSP